MAGIVTALYRIVMSRNVPRGGVDQASVGDQVGLRTHEQRYLTSGCTCRRARGNGVGHFVTRGFSVRRTQKRFQNSSRFAAQVSREPLGCAKNCTCIMWRRTSGRGRATSLSGGESGCFCLVALGVEARSYLLTYQIDWQRTVACLGFRLCGNVLLQDLSS